MFRKALTLLVLAASFICLISCSDSVTDNHSGNTNNGSTNVDGPVSFVPGISTDTSQVPNGPAEVFACRYWPGELTLDDGTVVQNADRFYIRKSDTFQNCFILYYPAVIYDVYEAGGGGFSGFRTLTDTAFIWYIKQYYPDISLDEYPFNISNAKAFCDSIFSKKFINPSVKDVNYTGTREEALSDTSKYSSALSGLHYSCCNYNKYDLKNEKGSPITEDNLYLQITGDYAIVRYPNRISEIYEMVTKDFSTGSEYWTYVDIYYPELRNEQNTKVIVETLAGHYIEPKVEDFVEYFSHR